ncbi:DUF2235 domain-containing protein [Oceanibium sediminis]|uniref:DUF2235 domain-containing protein n=1 Tax=Oceanibium sediminis TaxID=2026339 RepID=UPI000DD4BAEE|nr:DUF2235 domain-containing protein [Oceanibium sediminis]
MTESIPRTHVFIIDGTLSRLHDGHESHAGLLYKMLREVGDPARQTVGYDPGIQLTSWRNWVDVAAGLTINQTIEVGYATLAARYRPGDRIMLFGYSRGAYAARSLAGFIGRIGLLRRAHATQRRVHLAFRYYEAPVLGPSAHMFSTRYCHRDVQIDMIGVWDTVAALGLPYPFLSRLAPMATEYHDHHLGDHVRNAFQALALDETRSAYEPLPWARVEGWNGTLQQAWFPGAHADIGGQLGGYPKARPLGHIPFRWIVSHAESCGLILPEGWRDRVPEDPGAPAHGAFRGRARYFLSRSPRIAGQCPSEFEHDSVDARRAARPRYRPKARWVRGPHAEEAGA